MVPGIVAVPLATGSTRTVGTAPTAKVFVFVALRRGIFLSPRLERDELEQADVMTLELVTPEEIYEELAARLNPDLMSLSIDEFLDVVFG